MSRRRFEGNKKGQFYNRVACRVIPFYYSGEKGQKLGVKGLIHNFIVEFIEALQEKALGIIILHVVPDETSRLEIGVDDLKLKCL